MMFFLGVFARTTNVWTLDARIIPSDIAAGDRFGNAVKVTGGEKAVFDLMKLSNVHQCCRIRICENALNMLILDEETRDD